MCCECGGGVWSECQDCPEGLISPYGSTSIEDCVDPDCASDEYFDTHYMVCLPLDLLSTVSSPTVAPGDPTALPIPAPTPYPTTRRATTSAPVMPAPSPALSSASPTETPAPTGAHPIVIDEHPDVPSNGDGR